jgi:hypothetical protein
MKSSTTADDVEQLHIEIDCVTVRSLQMGGDKSPGADQLLTRRF